jgi:hypothetical protein
MNSIETLVKKCQRIKIHKAQKNVDKGFHDIENNQVKISDFSSVKNQGRTYPKRLLNHLQAFVNLLAIHQIKQIKYWPSMR